MHRVCATYVNFVLFFIDRVPVNATIVNEAAHAVISDEAENPVGTRADHLTTGLVDMSFRSAIIIFEIETESCLCIFSYYSRSLDDPDDLFISHRGTTSTSKPSNPKVLGHDLPPPCPCFDHHHVSPSSDLRLGGKPRKGFLRCKWR